MKKFKLADEATAKSLKAKLDDGADFVTLAKIYINFFFKRIIPIKTRKRYNIVIQTNMTRR